MKRRLMAEKWNVFARLTIPADAPKLYRDLLRRAYYCGAQDIMFGVIQAFAPETEPTPADLQIMDDLSRELSDFAEDVKAGRA